MGFDRGIHKKMLEELYEKCGLSQTNNIRSIVDTCHGKIQFTLTDSGSVEVVVL